MSQVLGDCYKNLDPIKSNQLNQTSVWHFFCIIPFGLYKKHDEQMEKKERIEMMELTEMVEKTILMELMESYSNMRTFSTIIYHYSLRNLGLTG